MEQDKIIKGLYQIKNWKCNGDAEIYEVIASAIRLLEQPNITSDTISRQAAIDALDCISGTEEVLRSLPSAQPEYEPVTAEDFAKTMSEVSVYSYMSWHSEALALMNRQGFVICKNMKGSD